MERLGDLFPVRQSSRRFASASRSIRPGSPWCLRSRQRGNLHHRVEDGIAAERRVPLEGGPERLVGLKRLAHRLVHLAGEQLDANRVSIQRLRLLGRPLAGDHAHAKTAGIHQRLAQLGPLIDEDLDQVLRSRSGSRVRLEAPPTWAMSATTSAIRFESVHVAFHRGYAWRPADRDPESPRAACSMSHSSAAAGPAAGRLRPSSRYPCRCRRSSRAAWSRHATLDGQGHQAAVQLEVRQQTRERCEVLEAANFLPSELDAEPVDGRHHFECHDGKRNHRHGSDQQQLLPGFQVPHHLPGRRHSPCGVRLQMAPAARR